MRPQRPPKILPVPCRDCGERANVSGVIIHVPGCRYDYPTRRR